MIGSRLSRQSQPEIDGAIVIQVVRRMTDQQFVKNVGIVNVAPQIQQSNARQHGNPLQALKNSKRIGLSRPAPDSECSNTLSCGNTSRSPAHPPPQFLQSATLLRKLVPDLRLFLRWRQMFQRQRVIACGVGVERFLVGA